MGSPTRAGSRPIDRVRRDGPASYLVALDPFQTTAAAGSLSRVPCPTQLIWGTQDVMQPWEQVGVRLEAALPDPEVALLEGVGHFSPAEDPAAFARALLEWRPSPDG